MALADFSPETLRILAGLEERTLRSHGRESQRKDRDDPGELRGIRCKVHCLSPLLLSLVPVSQMPLADFSPERGGRSTASLLFGFRFRPTSSSCSYLLVVFSPSSVSQTALAGFSPETPRFLATVLERPHLGDSCRQQQYRRVEKPVVSHQVPRGLSVARASRRFLAENVSTSHTVAR